VQSQILICGLAVGAFALMFAYSRHDGPRGPDAAPATLAAVQPRDAATPTAAAAPVTAAAPAAAPALSVTAASTAAMNPPPVSAAPPPEQSEPVAASAVDNEGMRARGDRGAERGARSH
jgi:hypothetical protein